MTDDATTLQGAPPAGRRRRRLVPGLVAAVLVATLLPHLAYGIYGFAGDRLIHRWSETRWDSAGLAPEPSATPEAVIQVYAARAYSWKGVFAVHSWIAFKRAGASAFERYEVVGWGVSRGRSAVRRGRHPPDGRWAGHAPDLLLDRRGPGVEALIDRVEEAIRGYPHADVYRTWPGPNSNSFVAAIGRAVPELGLELPPTAIGKDFIPDGGLLARPPSGRGIQLSLWGLAGVTLSPAEGFELNLLGCTFGIDPGDGAFKIPAFGKVAPFG